MIFREPFHFPARGRLEKTLPDPGMALFPAIRSFGILPGPDFVTIRTLLDLKGAAVIQ